MEINVYELRMIKKNNDNLATDGNYSEISLQMSRHY